MTRTNPFNVIIDLKLEGDYIQQDSCVELMKEFAKREIIALKQGQDLPTSDVIDNFSLAKDYSKLFKDLHKEDCVNGSVYPSVGHPEAMYYNGKWFSENKIDSQEIKKIIMSVTCRECPAYHGDDEHDEMVEKAITDIVKLIVIKAVQ